MIATLAELTGNRQYYAIRDVGGCFGRPLRPGTLRAGTYPGTFSWDGVNWFGESDTGVPKGPPFPAGIYVLSLTARGFTDYDPDADAGSSMPFQVIATLRILLRD